MLEKLQAIWEKRHPEILARLMTLDAAARGAMEGNLDYSLRLVAAREAHKLVGVVGTFGFLRASELARQFEDAMEAADTGSVVTADLANIVRELHGELSSQRSVALQSDPGRPPDVQDARPVLMVVDPDPVLCNRLRSEGPSCGLRVEVSPTVAAARRALRQVKPAAMLVDISGPDRRAVLALIEEITSADPALPVLVFTDEDGLIDRVEAARVGCRGFLVKSLALSQVLDAVTDTLRRLETPVTTVLAIDDDPTALDLLEALLAPNGLAIRTLSRLW